MKKMISGILLLGAAISLPAEVLHEWTFTGPRPPGVEYPAKHVAFRIAETKTPEGEPCAEFRIKEAKPGVAWGISINFVSKQTIVAGSGYRYSFRIRGDRDAELRVSCIQGRAPWKTIGNSGRTIRLRSGWQTVSVEFTSNMDYDGFVRSPMLMAGNLPQGTVFEVGPVKLEKLVNFQPLALNPTWKLFLSPNLENVQLTSFDAVPQKLGGVAGKDVALNNSGLNLAALRKPSGEKTPAVLFNEFEAKEDGMMQVGCAADYWFEFIVNGKIVYDTLVTGNRESTYLPTDHVFNFPVKKGRNLIAVRVLSGSAGWKFVCGKVPFRAKTSRITQFVRGREWRPVKMDRVRWNKRALKSLRIDQFKRIPGSALDLSQYVRKYDIDKCGRLKADKDGRLYFENEPGVPVRLRGFNCVPRGWEFRFYAFTKAEIEEFADQIALAGMNVLRFHFLDDALAGNNGLPKQGKDRKDIADVFMAQNAGELVIDKPFADRYHYFLKCLRDRGIYVMLDIFTATGLFTGAVSAKEYPRFQMFDNPRYRNHWKAGFDYLLKHPNPYTGKALIDDPQLIGITFFNEQEHLFSEKSKEITRFTPEWRKLRGASAPEFNVSLLRSPSSDGAAARKFLRRKIAEMNAFYLGVVKESGFQGFAVNWDMFMRNLEGDARADFNAVAMHTYHAHPNSAPLFPASYKQRLSYGDWLRNKMKTVMQGSSIVPNNYLGRAAATRVLGKPFFMTEYSHCGYNRYAHEAAPMWAAYASLQDWQMLAPHSNLVRLYYSPFQPTAFDSAENLSAVMNSLFCAFGWQRGDIQSAKHAVSFHVPERVLDSPNYVGAIGSGYNGLFMLTRIGSDYRNPKNPLAALNVVPELFVGATSMGMWVRLDEEKQKNAVILRDQVANLRRTGILPAANRTDVNAGIFESETGEICANLQKNTLTVDTPKFQAAVLKKSEPAGLSNLSVKSVSTPCTVAAISLENDSPIADSGRLLVVVGTMFTAENAVFSTENFDAELDVGDIQQLMRSGQFDFSLKTNRKAVPEVYALNLNGSRERKLPVKLENGVLHFSLDTSALEYGTPYFEVVFPKEK